MRVREYKSTLVFFVSRCKFKNYNSFNQVFNLNIYVYMYLITFLLTYISI